jgi:hypothetical protein
VSEKGTKFRYETEDVKKDVEQKEYANNEKLGPYTKNEVEIQMTIDKKPNKITYN